jgi:hypothetical protein
MAQAQKSGGGGASLYYEVASFSAGIDLRKSELTAPAGTLRVLQNAHITQGGEIEKRSQFAWWCAAPGGSIGLCVVNDKVYTHIYDDANAGLIEEPTDTSVGVIHIANPRGNIKIDASYISDGDTSAGTILHVDSLSTSDGSPAVITVGAKVNGTGVAPGTVITSFGTGTGSVGDYNVNISQLSSPSSVDGGVAIEDNAKIQLSYDIFGGKIFVILFNDDTGGSYCYYNGIQATEANNKCLFNRTYKEKMYGVKGRYLNFSAVGDPTVWYDPNPDADGNVAHNGSGFIDIGSNDADSQDLLGMEVYYDKMAIFSRLSCQLWFLDPDPSLNQYFQTLRDAGTIAPTSVRQYVANDVYFLGTHGIRSLRARDLTTTAAVADVGSPIDQAIQDQIAQNGPFELGDVLYWSKAVLDGRTGRLWMSVGGDRIHVLSNWASPNISAWSIYLPSANGTPFLIDHQHIVFADPYVVLRADTGDIFRFGSDTVLQYDDCEVLIETPFLSFDKPATFKFYQGFDAICSNDPGSPWQVEASFDPTVTPTPFDDICQLDGPSIMGGKIPISGRGTHIQLNIGHQSPGPATFSKLFIHYAPSDTS